jgi:hypothetical protein
VSKAKGAIEALTTTFQAKYAGPTLARLAQLNDEEQRSYETEHGLGSFADAPLGPERGVPLGIADERVALRQRVGAAAAVIREEAAKHARGTRDALADARLSHSPADYQRAQALAATVHPDLLVERAVQLTRSDAAAADTYALAAKLTGKVRPSTLDQMSQAVEAALDRDVPERRSAAEAHAAAMEALRGLTLATNEAELNAAALAGDRRGAAIASIGQKLAARA